MAHLPSESTVNGHRRSHFRGQSASDGQGWGANFWCVITDPTSDASFFANPETGECRWEVPAGTIVLPPNPAGEWWELIDEQRDLPYFYHTQTGESVWEKPEGLVIPLVAVQESVLGRPISRPNLRSTCDSRDASSSSLSSSKSATDSICESSASSSSSVDVGILPSGTDDALTQNEIKSPSVVGEDSSPNTPKAKRRSIRFRDSPPSPPVESPTIEQVLASRARRSIITYDREVLAQAQRTPSIHFEGDRILASSKTLMERRHVTPSQDMAIPRYTSLSTFPSRQSTSPRKSIIRTASQWSPDADIPPVPPLPEGYPTSRSSTMAYVSNKESPENSSPSHRRIVRRERDPVKRVAPLPLDYSIGDTAVQIPTPRPVPRQRKSTISISTKRMSTGDHQCMPAELQSAIQAFKFEDFALQMFAIHRTGPLRRKVGIEQLVSWQSSGIGASLLQLEFKELQRDAIQIFRIIRNCMGDREESPVSRPGSRACSRPSSRAGSRPPSQSLILQVRWMLERGLASRALRDEIYVQLVKQLTKNPSDSSILRGWQLLSAIVVTFPPSKQLAGYLLAFIDGHVMKSGCDVSTMATHCLSRLKMIAQSGARTQTPLAEEIVVASRAAFLPCVFGKTLNEVMQVQVVLSPGRNLPKVLVFLCESILANGGPRTEGVFRMAGQIELVTELRCRIDCGNYSVGMAAALSRKAISGAEIVHVLVSTLKLFLRELATPIIPVSLYDRLLQCSLSATKIESILSTMPALHRRVLVYLLQFMQAFLPPVSKLPTLSRRKMDPEALALIFAPLLFQSPVSKLSLIFNNSRFEQQVLVSLLAVDWSTRSLDSA
ncbi:MyTH4-domain-containing protein [Testicularia cyperi]|uniref:MyTH4-domain-containing protein n=1 Tax=Testicularia cyperi TaxID=1882483 RepID=A0A317XPZ2_9BASI|nr:MyTH4-domain-containing protein [Testicularia cyperi]